MNVYTYFEAVPELPQEDELKLIELWKQSWKRHGWNPVVLTTPQSVGCDGLDSFVERINSYPNVNAKRYEMACMLRWWSLRQAGGGLMVDYDVMNHGFTPAHLAPGFTVFNLGKCPCAVYADVQDCISIINQIFNFDLGKAEVRDGKPFVHDQVVMRACAGKLNFKEKDVCKEPNDAGREKALMVHYTNEWSYTENKRPRWKYVV